MNHPRGFAQTHPDRAAFIMAETGETVTYAQLENTCNQLAHVLRECGLQNGDHLAILLDNELSMLEVVWAAQRTGQLFTCISIHLNEDDVQYIINDCTAKVLVTNKRMLQQLPGLRELIPDVQHILLVDGDEAGCTDLYAAAAQKPVTPVTDEKPGTDMLYSSGTTGRPKGIEVTFKGENVEDFPKMLAGLAVLYGFDASTVYLSPAPLYHAAPLRFNMLVMTRGGTCIVMKKFDPEFALQLIEKYKVTHSQWVPIMFSRMLKAGLNNSSYDLSSHRMALHAAAPCPVEVKRQMIEWWGPIITEYYSSTEGIGFTSVTSEEWLGHQGTVGRPVFGVIHVVDENGEEVPVGETGQIFFEGGPKFEYFGDKEKTKTAIDNHGWYSVGDIGYVDEDGFLYLTDRKSFMIISGGVNIYPQEVENALMPHPGIRDVAVFGVPSEQFGEEVKAVVEAANPDADKAALADDIMAFCKQHLSHIKCPRSIDFIDAMPRTPTGKLYKKVLREQYNTPA